MQNQSHRQSRAALEEPGHSRSGSGVLQPGSSRLPVDLDALWADLDRLDETEWHFQRLADLLDAVFYVVEPDTDRVIYASPAFERVWGQSLDALYRNPRLYMDAVVPEDLPAVIEGFQRERRGESNRIQYRIQRPDGSLRWIWDRNFAVAGPPGRPSRVVGLATDVSEHRAAQDSMSRLERLEALGHLSGGLAHDFNNILGIVLGSLEHLQGFAGDDVRASAAIEAAIEAARRGQEIAGSLLAFARRKPLQRTCIDLNRRLQALMPLLHHVVGVRVALELRPGASELTVAADAGSLDSALINLVANARDALPDGGRVTISTCVRRCGEVGQDLPAELQPGDYALICVEDNGMGMPPEILERALEPLFTTKPEQQGTGLGLPMAYWMLRRHDGTLSLRSRPGAGTQACLYLPLSDECQGSDSQRPHTLASTGPEKLTGGEASQIEPQGGAAASVDAPLRPQAVYSVLAVEDDPALGQLIEMVLRDAGFEVTRVMDSDAAQRALQQAHYDVLLTDLMLPGVLDGRRLGVWAVGRQPGLTVVLASGQDLGMGAEPQNWFLLRKPYGPRELLGVLSRALNARASPGVAQAD